MTIAFYCVLIAALLPYLFTVLAKSGKPKYNNKTPREYLDNLQGWRKRAHWTQLNGFEAFPPFAIAVILAYVLQANFYWVNILAILFVIARIIHGVCYIKDYALLRTFAWLVGFFAMIIIFIISI